MKSHFMCRLFQGHIVLCGCRTFLKGALKCSTFFKGAQNHDPYHMMVHDSVQVDIATGKIQDTIRFDTGNLCMITGGANSGRVGTIMSRERHQGSFDIVHVKDSNGHVFATRLAYVFVIGKGNKPYISLPKGKGIKLSIAEERDKRLGGK